MKTIKHFIRQFVKMLDDKPKNKPGTIASFICEGGMIGKLPLKISKTVYPCSDK